MKLDWLSIQSPTGQLIVVGLLAAVAVGAVAWQRTHRKPVTLPEPKAMAPAALPKIFQRAGARFEAPIVTAPTAPLPSAPAAPAQPAVPRALPLTVFAAPPATTDDTTLPIAPYGRLIPCETVVTLESNRLETPVIGLVTEDVWENGTLVIPAGAEVHGRVTLDRSRERLAAEGSWMIVWRGSPPQGAREMRVTGLALDRELNHDAAELDRHDGSAGLRGEVLRTDDFREIKLFAATFLATATTALQDTRATAGLLGDTVVPAATVRNASLAGTSAILREYAQQLRDTIARDGFYVRVPAGKAFYLYVTQSLGANPPRAAAAVNNAAPSSP
jgi:hypothetical protein